MGLFHHHGRHPNFSPQVLFVDVTLSIEWLRRRGTKHLRLSVRRDGTVRVSSASGASEQTVRAFVNAHLDWIERARKKLANHAQTRLPDLPTADLAAKREEARRLVEEILQHVLPIYGFTHKTIRIKQQKTRWGSCSSEGNLNFNLRIIQLPRALAEYLVIHEVCHLKEMNHSARFWTLVARGYPDYPAARRALRTGYRLS